MNFSSGEREAQKDRIRYIINKLIIISHKKLLNLKWNKIININKCFKNNLLSNSNIWENLILPNIKLIYKYVYNLIIIC